LSLPEPIRQVYTDKLNVPGVSEMHLVFFNCLCRIINFSWLPLLHKKHVRIENILISMKEILFCSIFIWQKYNFAAGKKMRSLQKQPRVETRDTVFSIYIYIYIFPIG